MADIVLCNTPLNPELLNPQCGVKVDEITELNHRPVLKSYTPYLVGQNPSQLDRNIYNTLSPNPVSRGLTDLSLTFGADNTTALADISAKLREYNIGLMGASTSIYANRIQGFGKAVQEYQVALMEYRKVWKSNPAAKLMAKIKVQKTFQKMQLRFQYELMAVTARSRSLARRGTPLTSTTRAMNIARSSRTATKLNVTSQVQANNLVKFSQHAKLLGNGLAVIDFGSRVGTIHNSYQAGGNWEREMFIESTSFALSASAGLLAAKAGGTALMFLLAATPVGWVGLIIGGIIVAGTAAAVSITINDTVKNNSGSWYDAIMNWIESP